LQPEQHNVEPEVLDTDTIFYEPEHEGELNFDSGIVVCGFPTSIELDPTTQIAESLSNRGAEAALVTLNSTKGEAVNPERGAVYNTPKAEITEEIDEALESLSGNTAVFGYCAGGIYALESAVMERSDTSVFVGSDVPQGMTNYQGVMSPETDGVVFYDEKMDGRLDAIHLEVYGTDHLWVETPEDYGEAQVSVADHMTDESSSGLENLTEEYDWLEPA